MLIEVGKENDIKPLNVWFSGQSSDGTLGKELSTSERTETYIFIHGLGSSQNYYYTILPSIVPFGNCIIFDNEGAANSPLHSQPSVNSMAEDVINILNYYEIQSATVVGHSMGGMVALKSAELYESRVNRIILLGPVHPTEKVAGLMAGRIESIQQAGNLFQISEAVPKMATAKETSVFSKAFIKTLILSQTSIGYSAACKVIVDATPPNYSAIKVPVLLIIGDQDYTAPYDGCGSVIEAALSSSSVTTRKLPHVGHWYCVESPDTIAAEIVNWLKQ